MKPDCTQNRCRIGAKIGATRIFRAPESPVARASIFLEGLPEALSKPTVGRITVLTLVPSKKDRDSRYIEGERYHAMAEDRGIVLGQTLWNGQDKIGSSKHGRANGEVWDRHGDASSESAGFESLG